MYSEKSTFLVTQELGLIRKPASFMTSICDERGQELIYAGMPITEVFKSEIGLGGTLGLLWFQRRLASLPMFLEGLLKKSLSIMGCVVGFLCRLPRYACQFIEMCLMVTADHGPAVSGAHNTIVCARAGKDLISSLTSGLLTIVRSLFNEISFHVAFLKTVLPYCFRGTVLEVPWMLQQSSLVKHLTVECSPWSL